MNTPVTSNQKMRPLSLWSFLRTVLSQGGDIWIDHQQKSYEQYSARLDLAARERTDELERALSGIPAVETSEARDAARYRFLRQPGNAIVYAKDRNAWGKNVSGHVRWETPEQLDAAVDAAMGSPENGSENV